MDTLSYYISNFISSSTFTHFIHCKWILQISLKTFLSILNILHHFNVQHTEYLCLCKHKWHGNFISLLFVNKSIEYNSSTCWIWWWRCLSISIHQSNNKTSYILFILSEEWEELYNESIHETFRYFQQSEYYNSFAQ